MQRILLNQFIYLALLLFVQEANSVHITKDHTLDYYQLPTETKNTGILHDTDIEAPNIDDAEDDEDYEENVFGSDKSNSLNKLESDQKTSANEESNQENLQHQNNNILLNNVQSNVQSNVPSNVDLENNIKQQSHSILTTTNSHTSPSVILSNSTTILNSTTTNQTTTSDKHLNIGSKSSEQLIIGLQLYKGLTNTTRKTGQNVALRCIFKCIKNAAAEKCDIKASNIKWTKNEAPLKSQRNKIEITFSRRKNNYKDIVSKLNIYKLDIHDRGFYKCEIKYNRQIVDSVGVLQINDQDDMLDDSMKIETAIQANFDEIDDGSSLNPTHYEPSLGNMDLFQKSETNKLFSNSMDYLTVPNNLDKEQCMFYRDEICSQYLQNQSVIVQSPEKHRLLIKRLHNLVSLISDFKMTYQCLRFAMSALCHYTFPICEKHQEIIIRKRMMCREDCEMLEHSICKTEYELAKLQNIMNDGEGILPNCNRLPIAGSKESNDCIHLDLPNMLTSTILEEESCFHDNGRLYRGKVSTTLNGQRCLEWNNQNLMSIAEWPELFGGHNYCRNPDGKHRAPYCIVADGNSWRREICDLKECGDRLFLIISPVLIACLLFFIVICSCCCYKLHYYKNRKLKKNKKCMISPAILENTIRSTNTSYSTIQAAAQQRLLANLNNGSMNFFSNTLNNHTNSDLNLISMNKYGITYLPPSSNIELNSLLANSNEYQADSCYQMENSNNYQISSSNLLNNMLRKNLPTNSSKKGTNAGKSLKHYPLQSIVFLEELGQGAFGFVFKGELTLDIESDNKSTNQLESVIPIAIKTLKEDANNRFKIDFRREAELMADLQHPNIVALLGVCFDANPMCLLFEFMNDGDLHDIFSIIVQ